MNRTMNGAGSHLSQATHLGSEQEIRYTDGAGSHLSQATHRGSGQTLR